MTTVPAVTIVNYTLAGGNSLGPFNSVFPIEQAPDLQVMIYTPTAPPAPLVLGRDYTVNLPASPGPATVTLLAAVLATYDTQTVGVWDPGVALELQRDTSTAQPTDLGSLATFDPEAYTSALDHLSRNIQDVETDLSLALSFPPGEAGAMLLPAAARADTVIGFDSTGALAYVALSLIDGIETLVGPPGPAGVAGPAGPAGPPGAGSLGYNPLNVAGHGAVNGDITGPMWLDQGATPGPTGPLSWGFRGSPINLQNGNYGVVLADAGKTIFSNGAVAQAITIPLNATVAYPLGTIIRFINIGTGAMTITPASGVTIYWAGAGTAGARSLAQWGVASIELLSANTWLINGVNLS